MIRAPGWLRRPRLGAAVLASGLALGAYVGWPCATWGRRPAPGAAARAQLAAHLAARCDALGSHVAARALTCWVATEGERLPIVPRACVGRAHHVLRLEAAFYPARRADAGASVAPLVIVLAALTAAFPGDAPVQALHLAAQAGPAALRAALGARGYRVLELAEAGAPLRTLALPGADAPAGATASRR